MESVQQELFYEDIYAALSHVINALGGPKKIGVELWPSLAPDHAGRKVNHCLNAEHAQNFHPTEIVWLLAQARKHGVHSAMTFLGDETGYQCTPIEPENEQAKLQREFIKAIELQKQLMKRMEKFSEPNLKGVA